jgi:MFS family permease
MTDMPTVHSAKTSSRVPQRAPASAAQAVEDVSPHGPAPAASVVDHALVRSVMVGLMLAMFLSALEQSIVAPALPTIGRSLSDVENLSWVVTAYLLSATAVTPLFGKLSDIYGRRVILLIAIGIFIAGSIACALAPSMLILIVARGVQGLGGGGILPLAQTIIADLLSPRERPRYQSYSAVAFV